MKLSFLKNGSWVQIVALGDNDIFDNIDGYNGSESTVIVKIENETGDPQRNNVMLRMIEKFNSSEFPLVKTDEELLVKGGNPKIDGKLRYLIKKDVVVGQVDSGIVSVPDENGLVKLGDLTANNGILYFSVRVKCDGKILVSFGELLKISDIYFYFTAVTK